MRFCMFIEEFLRGTLQIGGSYLSFVLDGKLIIFIF
jgi:hypothetical protein